MKKQDYTAPEIEIITIVPEKGYAASPGAPISPWEPGNF